LSICDKGILQRKVVFAGSCGGDIRGVLCHCFAACWEICGAGVVKGLGDTSNGFLCLEEGIGVLLGGGLDIVCTAGGPIDGTYLEKKREWQA
jgi:hypothetical protein